MKIGIVTCKKCPNLTASEQSLIPLFLESGASASPVVWNDPRVVWEEFSLLLIRSIWDYHLYPEEFNLWLTMLENARVRTLNPIGILKANHHKFYLRQLERQGVRILPSLFIEKGNAFNLSKIKMVGWQRAVIKPAISASAYQTRVFDLSELTDVENDYRVFAMSHDLLVQEFTPAIQENGELSIIFINQKYSHAVLKKPRQGEYRVQAEYGGHATAYQPHTKIILAAAKILTYFDEETLYARIDGIAKGDEFTLMEAELIEPDLFLDAHPDARTKLVESTLERCPTPKV